MCELVRRVIHTGRKRQARGAVTIPKHQLSFVPERVAVVSGVVNRAHELSAKIVVGVTTPESEMGLVERAGIVVRGFDLWIEIRDLAFGLA